jgi:hypothetical protein
MLKIAPPLEYPRRRPRPRRQFGPPPTPPAALVLVEAAFDEVARTLRLTFDRAIDIATLDGAQITVDDGAVTAARYEAVGPASLDGPAAVVIGLLELGPTEEPGTLLTAGAGNGIVATDDGGPWAGVTDVALPFP